MMETTKRPEWLGLLSSTTAPGWHGGFAERRRGKRNLWVVVGFFAFVAAAWVNSQL